MNTSHALDGIHRHPARIRVTPWIAHGILLLGMGSLIPESRAEENEESDDNWSVNFGSGFFEFDEGPEDDVVREKRSQKDLAFSTRTYYNEAYFRDRNLDDTGGVLGFWGSVQFGGNGEDSRSEEPSEDTPAPTGESVIREDEVPVAAPDDPSARPKFIQSRASYSSDSRPPGVRTVNRIRTRSTPVSDDDSSTTPLLTALFGTPASESDLEETVAEDAVTTEDADDASADRPASLRSSRQSRNPIRR